MLIQRWIAAQDEWTQTETGQRQMERKRNKKPDRSADKLLGRYVSVQIGGWKIKMWRIMTKERVGHGQRRWSGKTSEVCVKEARNSNLHLKTLLPCNTDLV